MPGAKAVFEKFADYVPRQEKASWLAGGKQMLVDRIEWVVIPDPATAAAALQNGEVDWWESPITDLVPLLKKNNNIEVDIADPLGNIGSFRMNHLHPPFNDVKVRRAVLMALSQEDYMRALVGDDTALWKPLPGFFTPDTPLYTEEGGEILKGKRDLDAAKKLLAESGYSGQPVTCVVAQDQPITKAQGDVTADLLKQARHECRLRRDRLGHGRLAPRPEDAAGPGRLEHVPHLARRRGLHQSRRLQRHSRQRRQGLVRLARQRDRGKGSRGLVRRQEPRRGEGRGRAPQQGGARGRRLCADRLLPELQAWRKNVSGIAKGPLPFFWGVSKTA